jgi:DNA polymerase I-like protein with 3'-5' exonuclease and polymerase domains
MKTTFIKDTVISIDYKDAKYIVSYFNGYAKIEKYVKDVFNSSSKECHNY